MTKHTYDRPSDVVAEEGRVIMDGPDHVDVAFTPDAARLTGGRLIDAATIASKHFDDRGQSEEPDEPPAAD